MKAWAFGLRGKRFRRRVREFFATIGHIRGMKILSWCSALLLSWVATVSLWSQSLLTLPEPSPAATVSQTIGITEVTVKYHRPSVRGREIWGKLAQYGYNYLENFGTSHEAPWRAGANENTLISFQHDVTIAGRPLKAGTYGLSMALTSDGTVTVIFSNDSELWGSFFYDKSRDALRVDVKWEDSPFRELLTYDFVDVTKDSALLVLSWEKKRIPIPIKTDTTANVVASMKNELRNARGFNASALAEAASYLLTNNLDLNLALQWVEEAINNPYYGERNYRILMLKSRLLEKMGRTEEAAKLVDEAIPLGAVLQLYFYGRAQIAAGKPQRALEVFKTNLKLHPNTWPVHEGLARGYSALGDFKSAQEALLLAQQELPAGDAEGAEELKANLEKLKRGQDFNKE